MIALVLNIVGGIFFIAAIAVYVYKNKIRKFLYKLSMRLQLSTLRGAIHSADANKEKNDRKNMVIFNSVSKEYEAIEKRTLKRIADKNKQKSNAALTKFRKKNGGAPAKKRILDSERVKIIEEKSPYVTR